ncbi:MAG: hypothetical protein KGL44_09920 [Sphingomonadales bacterium]|nr:hypothetical protein [Sphingomonadales bacterium]
MPRYKMIALTNPVEGREDEFNDWYQNVHLPQVCALPGIKGAQRYRSAAALQDPFGRKYLAVYDIETDNLGATLGAFGQAAQSGALTSSDAANNADAYTVIFEEFGERVGG